MLVFVSTSDKKFYYIDLQSVYKEKIQEIGKKNTVTVRIPVENNSDVLSRFLEIIQSYYNGENICSETSDGVNNIYSPFDTPGELFLNRLSEAFPGTRGIRRYDNSEFCADALQVLLRNPLYCKISDPFWMFNGNRALYIDSIKKLSSTQCLISNDEIEVDNIVVYRSFEGYKSFVYVEVKPMKPTGLYLNYNKQEEIDYFGYAFEEYACFDDNCISIDEYNDGFTIVNGKRIKIDKTTELRNRCITPFNFIISPKTHSFNSKAGCKFIG